MNYKYLVSAYYKDELDDFEYALTYDDAYRIALEFHIKGYPKITITDEDGVEELVNFDLEGNNLEEGMSASLLNVKNQLMKKLSDTFNFTGGSMIDKFTMTSTKEPDVSFEVAMDRNDISVLPKYNGMPDTMHKKRGIAIMRAVNVISDFVSNFIDSYKPATATEGVKLRISEGPSTRIKKTLFGDYSGKIRTFAVLSAENPMGMKNSAEENNKATKELKQKLKEMAIQYVPIEGKYGSIEHSFMLFNITREDAQYLAEWFEQESFFFGINTSPATIIYYETSEEDPSTYEKKEINNKISNESDADDFFSRHGDFKFKFDMDYFKESVRKIADTITKVDELNLSLQEQRTMKSRFIHRLKSRK